MSYTTAHVTALRFLYSERALSYTAEMVHHDLAFIGSSEAHACSLAFHLTKPCSVSFASLLPSKIIRGIIMVVTSRYFSE